MELSKDFAERKMLECSAFFQTLTGKTTCGYPGDMRTSSIVKIPD
jgi:hypothetical protein